MIMRIGVIAFSVVADAFRRKLVYVVILFALVLSLAIPYLPSFGVGVVVSVFRELALTVMFVAAAVVTVALAATRLPAEFERRTVFAVLSRSVSRMEYLVGTWIGTVLTLAWVVAAFTIVAQVAGGLSFGEPNWRLWQGALAIWLEMGVLAAICLAFSTRTGVVTTALGGLVFLFVGNVRGELLEPADGLLWTLYPSLDAFNVINPVAHGSGISVQYTGGMLLVFVGYSLLLLGLAYALFRGRDL
jgi:ABC-type transport system involved in multi-copper enzyme maturation permease subunit